MAKTRGKVFLVGFLERAAKKQNVAVKNPTDEELVDDENSESQHVRKEVQVFVARVRYGHH